MWHSHNFLVLHFFTDTSISIGTPMLRPSVLTFSDSCVFKINKKICVRQKVKTGSNNLLYFYALNLLLLKTYIWGKCWFGSAQKSANIILTWSLPNLTPSCLLLCRHLWPIPAVLCLFKLSMFSSLQFLYKITEARFLKHFIRSSLLIRDFFCTARILFYCVYHSK